MTEKELLALHKRILGFARKWNKPEDAEDITTEAIIARLNGKGEKQVPQYSAFDGKRKVSGDERTFKYRIHNAINLDSTAEIVDSNDLPDERAHYYRLLMQYRDALKNDVHKFIFILKVIFGFKNDEIAFCFGCDEVTVCHILARIKRSLTKKFPSP